MGSRFPRGNVHLGHTICTAAKTRNAFQWGGQPQNCPFSLGTGPHLIHGYLGPPESALPQAASRSFQSFFQGSRTWPIDISTDRHTGTQTDHATSSVSRHAMWPNNNNNNNNNNSNNIRLLPCWKEEHFPPISLYIDLYDLDLQTWPGQCAFESACQKYVRCISSFSSKVIVQTVQTHAHT